MKIEIDFTKEEREYLQAFIYVLMKDFALHMLRDKRVVAKINALHQQMIHEYKDDVSELPEELDFIYFETDDNTFLSLSEKELCEKMNLAMEAAHNDTGIRVNGRNWDYNDSKDPTGVLQKIMDTLTEEIK